MTSISESGNWLRSDHQLTINGSRNAVVSPKKIGDNGG